jgi:hypothetical protein
VRVNDVLFRCRVRGTNREGERIRLSLNFAFARRADLILTDTELVWGDWSIPYAEIEDAVLVSLGSSVWFRLIVRGRGQVYQFLLPPASRWTWEAKPDPFWDGPLPFPLRRVAGQIELGSVLLVFVLSSGLLLALWFLAEQIDSRSAVPFFLMVSGLWLALELFAFARR